MSRIGVYTLLSYYQSINYTISHALVKRIKPARYKYCYPWFQIDHNKFLYINGWKLRISVSLALKVTVLRFYRTNATYRIIFNSSTHFEHKFIDGEITNISKTEVKVLRELRDVSFAAMIQLLPLLEQI
jgi:hypothetical protein